MWFFKYSFTIFGVILLLIFLYHLWIRLPSDEGRPAVETKPVTVKEKFKTAVILYLLAIILGCVTGLISLFVPEIKKSINQSFFLLPGLNWRIDVPFAKHFIRFSYIWAIILILGVIFYIFFFKKLKENFLEIKENLMKTSKDKEPLEIPVHQAFTQIEDKQGFSALPPLSLLDDPGPETTNFDTDEIRKDSKSRLEKCFNEYKLDFLKVVKIDVGPSIIRFTVSMNSSGRVSNVLKLKKDIAIHLGVNENDLLIDTSPHGLIFDIPNSNKITIPLKEVLDLNSKNPLNVVIGQTATGEPLTLDITSLPHLLIAGTTGSGKSVCLNAIIASILFSATPDKVKFIFIDPKVVELSPYNDIPHLLSPVVTDPVKATAVLEWAVSEMEQRYSLFAEKTVKNISSYNEKTKVPLPYIIIVIDELADLMVVAKKKGKDTNSVEESIQRLGQMARAAGLHLIIGTQRPSIDVITGTIKANIPGRIAFAVQSSVNSRIILDCSGAEKLLGKGDGLLLTTETRAPIRFQSSFISDKEVEKVTNWWQKQKSSESLDFESTETEESEDKYYIKMKKYIAELALSDEEEVYLPSINVLPNILGFSKPYIISCLKKLCDDKWVEKTGASSPRTTKYKVLISQEDASEFLIK